MPTVPISSLPYQKFWKAFDFNTKALAKPDNAPTTGPPATKPSNPAPPPASAPPAKNLPLSLKYCWVSLEIKPSESSSPNKNLWNFSECFTIPVLSPRTAPSTGPPTSIPRMPPVAAPPNASGATSLILSLNAWVAFSGSSSPSSPNNALLHPAKPDLIESIAFVKVF